MEHNDNTQASILGFIGAGNMAFSLVKGLLNDGWAPAHLRVSDPQEQQLTKFADLGVTTTADNNEVVQSCSAVVLAVKPQVAGAVLGTLSTLRSEQLLISIVAGINIGSLTAWTAPEQAIVRCMPNTPALIGAGMTALFANRSCSAEQSNLAQSVLNTAGQTLWVEQEQMLDAVTAVSGSGPAYFFLLMEAIIAAGIELGLSPEIATKLTLQTAQGAALMAKQSADAPATLRHNVTSPGGTTAAALDVMQDAQMQQTIKSAVTAAQCRAAELAVEFGS